jgi:hypothetical protein
MMYSYSKNNSDMLRPLYIGVGVVLLYIFYKAMKGGKLLAGSISSDIASSVSVAAVKEALSNSGVDNSRASVVTDAADQIYKALYNYYYGMAEDEPAVIAALNGLRSSSEAIACARVYKANFGKSLYADIQKYLSLSERNEIKASFLLAIKPI